MECSFSFFIIFLTHQQPGIGGEGKRLNIVNNL